MIQTYKHFWIILGIILVTVQFYVYESMAAQFQDINDMAVSDILFPLLSNFSIIIIAIIFFFLNVFTIGNETFLLRLPLNKKHIYMAYYYPIILSMLVFFLLQSIGGLVAFWIEIELSVWQIILSFGLYVLYLAILLLVASSVKVMIQLLLKKMSMYYFFMEIIFTLIFLGLYIFFFVLTVRHWPVISPAYWMTSVLTDNTYFIWIICLALLLLVAVFQSLIGQVDNLNYRKKNHYRSVHYRRSIIYNGFLFEGVSLIRDQKKMINALYGVFLGIGAVIISYVLLGQFNQTGYFNFLILFIGFSCSYISIYSTSVEASIRNLPIRPKQILIGKVLFYIAYALVIFHISFLLFKVLKMEFPTINVILWSFKTIFVTSLVLFVNALINLFAQGSKMITAFIIGLVYIVIDSSIGLFTLQIVQIISYISLAVLLSISFLWLYGYQIERGMTILEDSHG